MRRIGKHISIAGGLVRALERAHELGCTSLQFFSRNPRGWATSPLTDEDAAAFREARVALDLDPVVIHVNYLVNLAAPDPFIRERSIAAFRDELERSERLGADYLVVHPGSARGAGVAAGISACVDGIRVAARGLRLDRSAVLIENTAGQGDCIGRAFEQIGEIIARCENDVPIGMCLDTAHTFAAGYPIHTEGGFRKTMRGLDSAVGHEKVRAIHFNDSKAPFASNVDRHWHIGLGEIGEAALRRLARFRRLAHAAILLETPQDDVHTETWNLNRLRAMVGLPGRSEVDSRSAEGLSAARAKGQRVFH
ncbi:MAG: deoxyribonuclease IV [Acidobacteria bacterium]|nr:deoxyribonuclease IV [Acidobacteriota bacterium]